MFSYVHSINKYLFVNTWKDDGILFTRCVVEILNVANLYFRRKWMLCNVHGFELNVWRAFIMVTSNPSCWMHTLMLPLLSMFVYLNFYDFNKANIMNIFNNHLYKHMFLLYYVLYKDTLLQCAWASNALLSLERISRIYFWYFYCNFWCNAP